ncbi:glycosyltransferase [Rheinheimera soli]|jgi:UDP-N-acetylglucosamine transferase subunit ALG13|uniref:UDP-N-acetylglucosamine transferase subunit ALG13 n=1 Tax=Rheinheimera soli TaxID=443616 RepID=A0ABU1VVH6_9GAMM|nr:glycosyltransferase [Rheinheimera soli]MDR7119378.1 UDP-N-acetylglucosamine transferase subunit ALG13 [Rheinheimera soli]
MSNKIVVIASAGGHLTQALCACSKLDDFTIITNLNNLVGIPNKVIVVRSTQFNFFVHLLNFFVGFYLFARLMPKVVISTGGPIFLPFAVVARLFGCKVIFIDTLSRVKELSNTGKMIKKLKLAHYFICQWKAMAEKFDCIYLGKCFDILSENAYPKDEEINVERPLIFVTVGTNVYMFARLFEYIAAMPLYKDPRVDWVIQSGPNLIHATAATHRVVSNLSRPDVEDYVQKAALVISHCGIGSINLMLSYRKTVIFIPRLHAQNEFSDDHQLQIAEELVNDKFYIVSNQRDMPDISYEQLAATKIIKTPVDIVNYKFAEEIRKLAGSL